MWQTTKMNPCCCWRSARTTDAVADGDDKDDHRPPPTYEQALQTSATEIAVIEIDCNRAAALRSTPFAIHRHHKRQTDAQQRIIAVAARKLQRRGRVLLTLVLASLEPGVRGRGGFVHMVHEAFVADGIVDEINAVLVPLGGVCMLDTFKRAHGRGLAFSLYSLV